jgi:hypothetical protein
MDRAYKTIEVTEFVDGVRVFDVSENNINVVPPAIALSEVEGALSISE